ncbi:MAG: hypothetical protein C5B51_19900 [Terriglobia bacterium]|nr:MAG: hypothetical protein C5B51_19900 [Terriglobia bacterium]
MALIGYEVEKQKIDDKIRDLQAQLKGSTPTAAPATQGRAKRVLSAAARRRIAAAQRKRWAEHRKQMAQSAK